MFSVTERWRGVCVCVTYILQLPTLDQQEVLPSQIFLPLAEKDCHSVFEIVPAGKKKELLLKV